MHSWMKQLRRIWHRIIGRKYAVSIDPDLPGSDRTAVMKYRQAEGHVEIIDIKHYDEHGDEVKS